MAKKDVQDPRKRQFFEELLEGISGFFRELNRESQAPPARERDWQKSPAYLLFLSVFLAPRKSDDLPNFPDWRSALGEEPQKAIERLLDIGWLVRASLGVHLSHQFTVAELRNMLRERKLPLSGRKNDLILRLILSDAEGMEQAVTSLTILECSEEGRKAWRQYQERLETEPDACSDLRKLLIRLGPGFTQRLKRYLEDIVIGGVIGGVLGNLIYDLLIKERFVEKQTTPSEPLKSPSLQPTLEPTLTPTQAAPTSTPQPGPEPTKQSIPSTRLEPELIFIPAGSFLMGTSEEDIPTLMKKFGRERGWYDREVPRHQVYVGDFHIAKYPVTNAEYKRFVDANLEQTVPYDWYRDVRSFAQGEADHPVVSVTWHDAVAYCRWLTKVTGRSYRLPTEAEWEKAARGRDGRIYPWGDEWDAERCNTKEDGKWGTTLVGSYPQGASPYGVLDMAGNVWEWCHSLYRPYPYNAQDGREDAEAKGLRVVRGGGFCNRGRNVRCATRYERDPDVMSSSRGFRIALAPGFRNSGL
jgi:formylglycine-generating enzyme required for sulfatase activity